ncbi:MAG: hypothetical protein ACWGKN_13495 [Desulfoprunum sp.]
MKDTLSIQPPVAPTENGHGGGLLFNHHPAELQRTHLRRNHGSDT